MIPTRPSRIFRSRWWALFWAAGVIWTALSVAGTAPSHASHAPDAAANASASDDGNSSDDGQLHDATGAPVSADQIRAIANLVG